ncbi:MAG: hypothetical protein U0992_07990 [Planctomycetaceae bacterium]
MDFRTCPACKASVLEDDAEDCPFCGASMSGKPSAKPVAKPAPAAAKAPAASAKPQASSAAAGGKTSGTVAAKRRPTPEELDDGSDPFEVDTRAVVKAPPVSPKPAKGRMQRVVCPMCETPGFISPQQVGKEVKCCNPQCLMPVFTVPKPKEAPVEEAPKRSVASIIFAVSAVVLIGGVGAALYFFVLKDDQAGQQTKTPVAVPAQPSGPNKSGEELLAPKGPKGPTGPDIAAADEIRTTSLAEVEKAAQSRQNNRSKPFGRRMAAEAFADLGRFDQAREQLADMRKVQGYLPYYEIEPLVMIAAGLAAQGDAAGSKATLDEALSKAEFPLHGRDTLDAAGPLVAALAATGRMDEAARVASTADDSGTRGRAFVLWRDALESGSLNLDAAANRPYLFDMPSAQWVAVTQSLVKQGRSVEALAWARSATNPAARDNALATLAGGLSRSQPGSGDDPAPAAVTAALADMSLTAQARVWAAVADACWAQGNKSAAADCLTRATAALDQVPVPAPMPVPDLKEIHDSEDQPRAGLPDPSELRSAALAATDIAQVRAVLGDTAAAWTSMERALAYLRGSAPSPAAAQALLDECDTNRAGLESRLKAALGVDGMRVFLAFNRYRKQCDVVSGEAAARFDLQVRLLRRAVVFGLRQPVWAEAAAREKQADPGEREPYFGTLLPGTVFAYATAAKDTGLAGQVQAAIPQGSLKIDPRDHLVLAIGPHIDADQVQKAADLLRAYDQQEPGDYYTSQLMALRGISKLIAAKKHKTAMDLAVATIDPLLREDAVQLIAAAAVRDGVHTDLWRRRAQLGLSPTEMASFYRGCIRGLKLRPPAAEGEPAAATSESTKPAEK